MIPANTKYNNNNKSNDAENKKKKLVFKANFDVGLFIALVLLA